MIQINNLSYRIGENEILANIDWTISPGTRIALIGSNGSGKTTLLRLMAGEVPLQTGSIHKPNQFRIGHLPQEEILPGDDSVLSLVLRGNPEILDLEKQIYQLQNRLQVNDNQQSALLEKLGRLQDRYQLASGYRVEAEAKKILTGLGFELESLHRSLTEFSGGWRMRAFLARLLLQKPDLLLLDEPTNHLDIPSLEWLEDHLRSFPGSIVIVSHDRYFIDRLANEIIELEKGHLHRYQGNYQYYEMEKKNRLIRQKQEYENQQKQFEKDQQFINRFRAKATKARQVQSRIRKLKKIEPVSEPQAPQVDFHFRLKVATPSYKEVLKISDLFFRYETDWILQNIQLELFRGQKVALVGLNGAGKTTLTRLIAGQLQPQRGTLRIGRRVTIGYYAQHQIEQLNLNNTIYDEVLGSAASANIQQIRDLLGVFRFTGDDIQKPVRVLSGGEKARVSLAKMLLSPANFLIMDEPTNHLDIGSRRALEEALARYDGTLILISHDRFFLDKLVTRVLELRKGRLQIFEGNYTSYLEKKQARGMAGEAVNAPPTSAPANSQKKERKRREAEIRQTISRERNDMDRQISEIEAEIEQAEAKKNSIEKDLANPQTYQNSDSVTDLQIRHSRVREQLNELYSRWEELQSARELLMKRLETMLREID